MLRCLLSVLIVVVWLSQAIAAAPQWQADEAGYTQTIAPFFASYCLRCHSGDKPKGDFALDAKRLPNDFLDSTVRGKWKEVVNVLNGHEMPPRKEKQPSAREVAAVVDWITAQTVRAEQARRERTVVLRRLNRVEYQNTIRDLLGVDFDASVFPQDPPAGGFDNNGSALTVSPLHLEMYLNAARTILDRALVEGDRPPSIRWRFEPKVCDIDSRRIRLDARNPHAILNGGSKNRQEGSWIVVHHHSWDNLVGARDFRVPVAGTYAIRVQAASRIPTREQVVASAAQILSKRRQEQEAKEPKRARFYQEQYQRNLDHFRTARIYDYGPARARLVLQLGPQPRTVAEFDCDGRADQPKVHEFRTRFTTEPARVTFEYAYSIPHELENFWLQKRDEFARPELLLSWFEIEGPLFDAWPPRSHRTILFDSPLRKRDERGYAREVLARFLRRAYRRPVAAAEVDSKLALFDRARKEGASFVQAIRVPLTACLVSPHFLYLVEPVTTDRRPLTDHELACRLSYFLWSSMPDEELSRLADAGKLRQPEVLRQQVNRLLADPRAEALVQNFAGQWLGLREVGLNPPAPDLFPEYDRHLETSFIAEGQAFFREILHNDLPLVNFIRSDFVTINERLARFYGIEGVRGDHFRKVPVPANVRRGGILTLGAMLTITSNGTRTSPVKRGTWILKNLLGLDPGLPVANVGEIAPKVPGIDKATVRQRLEIHRQLDQCARCHNKIDPLGLALENFNAAGQWREQEGFGYKGRIQRNDPKIDASAQLPDGTAINGVEGLQKALVERQELFLTCLTEKLFTYACGREFGLADRPAIQAAVAHLKTNPSTLRRLIHFIVTSEPFTTR